MKETQNGLHSPSKGKLQGVEYTGAINDQNSRWPAINLRVGSQCLMRASDTNCQRSQYSPWQHSLQQCICFLFLLDQLSCSLHNKFLQVICVLFHHIHDVIKYISFPVEQNPSLTRSQFAIHSTESITTKNYRVSNDFLSQNSVFTVFEKLSFLPVHMTKTQ